MVSTALKRLHAAQIFESKLPLDNAERADFVRSKAEILRKARSKPNGRSTGR